MELLSLILYFIENWILLNNFYKIENFYKIIVLLILFLFEVFVNRNLNWIITLLG